MSDLHAVANKNFVEKMGIPFYKSEVVKASPDKGTAPEAPGAKEIGKTEVKQAT